MEEQNQNRHTGEEGAEKPSARRHRPHHRRGGQNRRPQGAPMNGNSAEAMASAQPAVEGNRPAEGGAPAKNENRSHNHNKNRNRRDNRKNHKPEGAPDATGGEQKKQNTEQKKPHGEQKKPNGSRDQQKKRRGGNAPRQGSAYGPEDLYGKPTEDDVLTMDELRAKIVLKAADGSVPAKEKEAPTPVAEESAIPEFSSEMLFGDENPAEADPSVERVEVVGIRFRSAGKVYYFDPKGNKVRRGDCVIVETARGPEFGEVSFGNRMIHKTSTVSPLRPVLRVATEQDVAHNAQNREKEKEALTVCREKIKAHKLEMKLLDAQYAFDNSKLLFYFTSEGRVDFRDLVKDLASVFRTRIELRQIGIRDEAKMLGGLGACGRPLCCASFLSDFVQVSIKMAKEQGLSLNSAKISGVCGRLMCCLRYESDVYAEELRRLPSPSTTVQTPDGIGTVLSVNPLARTLRIALKDSDVPPKQFSADEITMVGRERNGNQDKQSPQKSTEKIEKKEETNA